MHLGCSDSALSSEGVLSHRISIPTSVYCSLQLC